MATEYESNEFEIYLRLFVLRLMFSPYLTQNFEQYELKESITENSIFITYIYGFYIVRWSSVLFLFLSICFVLVRTSHILFFYKYE